MIIETEDKAKKGRVENILSTIGGGYVPDFGAGKTFDFEPNKSNGNGWSVLLDSISGKGK